MDLTAHVTGPDDKGHFSYLCPYCRRPDYDYIGWGYATEALNQHVIAMHPRQSKQMKEGQ